MAVSSSCKILRALIVLALSSSLFAQLRGTPAPPSGPSQADVIGGTNRLDVHADIPQVESGKVTIKSSTTLVTVPAIVTGKDHAFLHGLKQEDFRIQEDGKEQKIAVFEEVNTAATPAVAASPEGKFSNTQETSPQRIVIILLDTLNTPFLDQAYARGQLVKFLSQYAPGDALLSLVQLDDRGLHILHDFTSDPNALLEAMKKVTATLNVSQVENQGDTIGGLAKPAESPMNPIATPGRETDVGTLAMQGDVRALSAFVNDFIPSAPSLAQARAIDITMQGFLRLGQQFAGVPGRKSMVWITSGLPFAMSDASSVPSYNLAPLYEEAMKRLADANIAVYPVDARGLVAFGFAPIAPPNVSAVMADRRFQIETDTHANLQQMADMTGGRAFYSRNDLTNAFSIAAHDGTSYYMLGYYLPSGPHDGGWRKLKVSVHAPDAHVSARSGFFLTPYVVDPDKTHTLDMVAGLTSPIDSTGLPLTLQWGAVQAKGDQRVIPFTVASAPHQVTLSDDSKQLNVDVGLRVEQNGNDVMHGSRTLTRDMTPALIQSFDAQGFEYTSAVALKPGSYNIRVVVRDNLTGRLGSVTAPLQVQ